MVVNMRRVLILAVSCSLLSCGSDTEPPRLRFDAVPVRCADQALCFSEGTDSFNVAGVRVLHKQVPGAPLVAANVLFDRGEGLSDARVAHAQYLLMRVIGWWGSERYVTNWSLVLNRLGTSHWASCGSDYMYSGIAAPRPHFESAWTLLMAGLTDPPIGLSSEGFAKLVAGYEHEFDTVLDEAPDAAFVSGWSLIAGKHPYNLRVESRDLLKRMNVSDLRTAAAGLLQPARMTIVVVGDVERAVVERLISESLRFVREPQLTSPRRNTPVPPLHAARQRTDLQVYPDAPAWHIRGVFPAPSAQQEAEFAALRLGTRVLSQRLYKALRLEDGLAYDIGVRLRNYRANFGTFELSTTAPALAMLSVRGTIETLLADGITDAELEAERTLYMTDLLESNQSVAGLMSTLGDWELTAGPDYSIDAHIRRVDEVTASDAQAALAASLPGLRLGAAGPGLLPSESTFLAELEHASADACTFACYCQADDPRSEERCNRMDDDCDGVIDEGATNACGLCGDPPAEKCDGKDDDCDGKVDEGTLNSCGVCGVQPIERCDRVDNDCDGNIDEGLTNICGGCGALTIDQCARHHTIFISSTTFAPDFATLSIADMHCQELAEAAKRSGTWKALLVDANHKLVDRIQITKPVFNTRSQLVATDSSEFFSGRARAAVTATESGGSPKDTVAWVGSADANCENWTTTSSMFSATQTLSSQLDGWLFGVNAGPCNLQRSVFCIDQD